MMLKLYGKGWVSYAKNIEKISNSYSIKTEDKDVFIYFPLDKIKEYEKWYENNHRLYIGLQYTTPKYPNQKYKDSFGGYSPVLVEANGNQKYYVFDISSYLVPDRNDTRFVLLGIDY